MLWYSPSLLNKNSPKQVTVQILKQMPQTLAKAKNCQGCLVSHSGEELKVTGSIPFNFTPQLEPLTLVSRQVLPCQAPHCCLKRWNKWFWVNQPRQSFWKILKHSPYYIHSKIKNQFPWKEEWQYIIYIYINL